ncbi:MAG TPA: hypothetical protein DIU39_08215, partial [Flavobacteriales bacterium]|nr:hypothetical protein [Flavobacteriales bacterium]
DREIGSRELFKKKKLIQIRPVEVRHKMVDRSYTKLSVRKQCTLLQISRSSFYYKPVELYLKAA